MKFLFFFIVSFFLNILGNIPQSVFSINFQTDVLYCNKPKIAILDPQEIIKLSHKTIKVKAGQTEAISEPETHVLELIMEDNATIILTNLSSWNFKAVYSKIGKNCKIIGRGKNGSHGVSTNGGTHGSRCGTGGIGGNGKNGQKGENGVNVTFETSFSELGNLTFDLRGGNSGNGSDGGTGGKGGQGSCNKKCNGGTGGVGGNGGNTYVGGNGGDLKIRYAMDQIQPSFNKNIFFNLQGGRDGIPGAAGAGGRGGDASTGICRSKYKKPGSNGKSGNKGRLLETKKSGKFIPESFEGEDCLHKASSETYAMIVSVSKSKEETGDNIAFYEDAFSLATLLKNNYEFEEVMEVVNPTLKELQYELAKITQYGISTKVLIFLNGHGLNYLNNPSFNTTDNQPISFLEVLNCIKKANNEKIALIINACRSGQIFEDEQLKPYLPIKNKLLLPNEICSKKGRTIVTAGRGTELVPVREFTLHLIEMLQKNKKVQLTLEELFYSIDEQMREVRLSEESSDSQSITIGKLIGTDKKYGHLYEEGDFIFFKKQ